MKYIVDCMSCGENYTMVAECAPKFCMQCGSMAIKPTEVKTKSRIRAEESMRRLEELQPEFEEKYLAYSDVRARYEDELQVLRQYKKRGIVLQEELDKYSIRNMDRISMNDELKGVRAKKVKSK